MTQDEVIENLELNKENVKIFEPTADIESTRVYAQLIWNVTNILDFRGKLFFILWITPMFVLNLLRLVMI